MHQEHAEMIVAVSPAPGWGLCVIDGHLPCVLRGLAPSELPLPLSEQECGNRLQSVSAARFCTAQE